MTRASLAVALVCIAGCSGENTQVGVGEPFRIHAPPKVTWAAQFVKGELPGLPPTPSAKPGAPPPPSAEGGPENDAGPKVLEVINISIKNPVYQGQGDVVLQGSATAGAYSVGVKLDGIGTGYWVVPTGALDVDANQAWEARADFDGAIPAGYHNLRAVPFDENGAAGRQSFKPLCVDSTSTAANDFNSCTHKSSTLPEAVISLDWDTNVDLDLQVRTPTGRIVDAKRPTAEPPNDAGVVPADTAYIDRDSNAGCQVDGLRHENLIFPHDHPPHGLYAIYANLFDACKQPSVRFTVTVYSARNGADGGDRHLAPYLVKSGELMDFQANGGSAIGLFVSEFKFR